MDRASPSNQVLEAIEARRSIRGFFDRPVPQAAVEYLLRIASHAPSGSNTQPWCVHVVTGTAKRRLTTAIMASRANEAIEPKPHYNYSPDKWPEPYLTRRRQLGWRKSPLISMHWASQLSTARSIVRERQGRSAPSISAIPMEI